MKTIRLLPVLALLALSTACVQTQVTMLGPKNAHAPVPATDVRVYTAESEIPVRFERVALIHAQGESTWTNEAQMIEAARRKAGSIGADAIVLGAVQEPSSGAKVAAAVFGVASTRRGQILAVRLMEPVGGSAAAASAPASTPVAEPEPAPAPAQTPLEDLPVYTLD